MSPSATLPANAQDDSFGSRKARSSFGKGFFKIRGGKKTGSTPNLGKSKPHGLAGGWVPVYEQKFCFCFVFLLPQLSIWNSLFTREWDFSGVSLHHGFCHTHDIYYMDQDLNFAAHMNFSPHLIMDFCSVLLYALQFVSVLFLCVFFIFVSGITPPLQSCWYFNHNFCPLSCSIFLLGPFVCCVCFVTHEDRSRSASAPMLGTV